MNAFPIIDWLSKFGDELINHIVLLPNKFCEYELFHD
jgi:hypothetical protein